jgi:hypothetical protein
MAKNYLTGNFLIQCQAEKLLASEKLPEYLLPYNRPPTVSTKRSQEILLS